MGIPGGDRPVNDRLWELYQTVCQEELRPLEEFVQRLVAREWGAFPKDDILDLLRELEGLILANIQVKAQEGARFAAMADEVSARTQREFEHLVALVEEAFRTNGTPAG